MQVEIYVWFDWFSVTSCWCQPVYHIIIRPFISSFPLTGFYANICDADPALNQRWARISYLLVITCYVLLLCVGYGRYHVNITFFVFINRGSQINPLTANLFNLNVHSLEAVSRWRDPLLQVSENYSDLTKWRSTVFKFCWLMSHFIFTMLKRWYIMC